MARLRAGTHPDRIDAQYRKSLVGRAKAIHRVIRSRLNPALKALRPRLEARALEAGNTGPRTDSADDDGLLEAWRYVAPGVHALVLDDAGCEVHGHRYDDDARYLRVPEDDERRLDVGTRAPGPGVEEDLEILREVIRVTAEAFAEANPPRPLPVERAAAAVDSYATAAVATSVRTVVRIDVPARTPAIAERRAWVEANLALSSSINEEAAAEITRLVVASVEDGAHPDTIARALALREDIDVRRAELIAENEIGTLNARINARRATEVGARSFIWSDSGDRRVRPEHRAADGNEYPYPEGHPTEGLPGEPIRCRCSQLPVIDDGDAARFRGGESLSVLRALRDRDLVGGRRRRRRRR